MGRGRSRGKPSAKPTRSSCESSMHWQRGLGPWMSSWALDSGEMLLEVFLGQRCRVRTLRAQHCAVLFSFTVSRLDSELQIHIWSGSERRFSVAVSGRQPVFKRIQTDMSHGEKNEQK